MLTTSKVFSAIVSLAIISQVVGPNIRRCSLCPVNEGIQNVQCVRTNTFACLGEVINCLCAYDCRDIKLECGASGRWKHLRSNGPLCGANYSYHNQSFGDHRFATYSHERGWYTFSCTPGYQLVGTSDVTCTNNVLSRPFPQCVQVQGGKTTTKPPTTTRKSNVRPKVKEVKTKDDKILQIAVPVGVTLFIVAMLVAIWLKLRGCFKCKTFTYHPKNSENRLM